MNKILYLYAEVMGYTLSTLEKLVNFGAEVHVVCYDTGKITPYKINTTLKIKFYQRSKINSDTILNLAKKIKPNVIVVSGWQDREYLSSCKVFVHQGLPVVCGFDDQWTGSLKQHFASSLSKLGIFKTWFTHAWVCGPRQFEYASRLGFDKNKILFDLYSADLKLFVKAFLKAKKKKIKTYPHNFLFVGRFEKVKGLDILLKAWDRITEFRKDWTLTMVGNGSLNSDFKKHTGVKILNFLQPKDLIKLIEKSGCFVLPSRFEPWGVVVHEFAAAGMPLILSNAVGSSDMFLINGANGYLFEKNNVLSLENKLLKIIKSSDRKLLSMSNFSSNLSNRVTPTTSARNLLTLCQK